MSIKEYIKYLIHCISSFTLSNSNIYSDIYHHQTNKINIDILNCQYVINIIKHSDKNISNFIDSDLFLKGLLQSFLVYTKGVRSITILLDTIFNTNKLNIDDKNVLLVFNSIYKGLSQVLNKDNKFFRHYLESSNYEDINIDGIYPPPGTYFDEQNAWPCEIGNALYKRDTPGNTLMVEYDKNKWRGGKFWGLVSLKVFDKYYGKIVIGNNDRNTQRDHLFAEANIPIKEWIFMLENIEDDIRTNKAIDHLILHCGIVDTDLVQLILGFKELILGKLLQFSRLK